LERQKPYIQFALRQGMKERRALAYAKKEAQKSLLLFWRRQAPLLFLSYAASLAVAGRGFGCSLQNAVLEGDLPLLRGCCLVLVFLLALLFVASEFWCQCQGAHKHRAPDKALDHKSPLFVCSIILFAGGFALGLVKSEGVLWLLGLSLLAGMGLAFALRSASRWPATVLYVLTGLSALSALALLPFSYEPVALVMLSLSFGLMQKALYAPVVHP
jgi:hypothetical protein